MFLIYEYFHHIISDQIDYGWNDMDLTARYICKGLTFFDNNPKSYFKQHVKPLYLDKFQIIGILQWYIIS